MQDEAERVFERWLQDAWFTEEHIQIIKEHGITDFLSMYHALSSKQISDSLKGKLKSVPYGKLLSSKNYLASEFNRVLLSPKEHYDGLTDSDLEQMGLTKEHLEIERKAKMEKIKRLTILIDSDSSIDIVFVMDITASMRQYLECIKSNILAVVNDIKALHPKMLVRLGFVGYRDHDIPLPKVVVHLSDNIEEFQNQLINVVAHGAGDEAEDVLGGLFIASRMNWWSSTRILYHVGDAPCHGSKYHSSGVRDNYPRGHCDDMPVVEILRALSLNKVHYVFGKINESTTKMIAEFRREWKEFHPEADIHVVKAHDMAYLRFMTEAVRSTLADTLSVTYHHRDSNRVLPSGCVLTSSPIDWSTLHTTEAMASPMLPIERPWQLQVYPGDQSCAPTPLSKVRIKVAPTYFAVGSRLLSQYGVIESRETDAVTTEPRQNVVLKTWIAIPRGFTPTDSRVQEKMYSRRLTCHRVASCLANVFNNCKQPGSPDIVYVNAELVQMMEQQDQPFAICETLIEGCYEKYSNNFGYCCPCPTNRGVDCSVVQTFSHWTYAYTKKHLMVVDCQGAYDAQTNTFHLTDPAIHCMDVLRYHSTNMADEGMRRFFETHVCNAYCEAMHLKPGLRR